MTGYIVVRNDGGTYRYLVVRRMGRHYALPMRHDNLRGHEWSINPKRATIFPAADQAQTRATRHASRGAWVEPSDHI